MACQAAWGAFSVILSTPRTALEDIPRYPRALIRNAWPSHAFISELSAIEDASARGHVTLYNPPHRGYLLSFQLLTQRVR